MRVFVGFGYNERDRWIEKLVFPMIEAFGHTVVTGEDLAGRPIIDGVAELIDSCDAVIGFATRRDPLADGGWDTHRWVTDELAHASSNKKRLLEVREKGVDEQGGIVGDRQYLEYDPNERECFLVELVKALGQWPRDPVRLHLIGNGLKEIVPLLRKKGFTCQCRFNVEGRETAATPVEIRPIGGGFFIDLHDVPPKALVQIEITYETPAAKKRSWASTFQSLELHGIEMIRDWE